jgi:hypothetical protein
MSEAASEIETEVARDVRVRRAMRQLRRSGRRLVPHGDRFVVLAAGRPAGELTCEEVALLKEDERLVEAEGGGMVLCAADMIEATCAPDRPADAWVLEVAAARHPSVSGRGFARMVKQAMVGEGPLSLRQANAGRRLIVDAELAARVAGTTMNWDAMPVDRQQRAGREGGSPRSARSAAARLRRVREAAGDEAFNLAWALCVEETATSVMAARAGLSFRGMSSRLAQALEAIAGAYDGKTGS